MSHNKENSPPEKSSLVSGISEPQGAPKQALCLTDRRKFLTLGAAGAAGLVLSPVERVLAVQQRCPELGAFVPNPQRRGFWATFLNILEVVAGIFGFGPLFRTVRETVEYVRSNYRQIASDALRDALRELAEKQYPYHINNLPSGAYGSIGIIPINPNFTSGDLRSVLPALRSDKFNGITNYLDFRNATRPKDFLPKGQISAPATAGIFACTVRDTLARYGYQLDGYLDAIVIPKEQTKKSFGNWNSRGDQCEQYTTATGATIEICYRNKRDTGSGGEIDGEVTHFGLEARNSSNKRMGIQRIRYALTSPLLLTEGNPTPSVEIGFDGKYTKGNRPRVT